VDIDLSENTFNKKVREAQLAQYNYVVVMGATEVQNGTASIRSRDNHEDIQSLSVAELVEKFSKELQVPAS
jgi:threonyl-tRNA synthetase